LGVSIAIARLAGPSGTGALGVALQVTALASMVAAFNVPQSLTRQLAASENWGERRRLLRISGWFVLGLSAVTGSCLLGLSRWLATRAYQAPELTSVIFWCGPLVVASAGIAWFEAALQGLGRFPTLTRWGAVVSVTDLALGAVAPFFGVVAVLVSRTLVRTIAVAGATAH